MNCSWLEAAVKSLEDETLDLHMTLRYFGDNKYYLSNGVNRRAIDSCNELLRGTVATVEAYGFFKYNLPVLLLNGEVFYLVHRALGLYTTSYYSKDFPLFVPHVTLPRGTDPERFLGTNLRFGKVLFKRM